MKTSSFLLIGTLTTFSSIVPAHDIPQTCDRINLGVSSAINAEQDELQAILYAPSVGEDAGKNANAVNNNIQQAFQVIFNQKTITAQTGNFTTQPVYRKLQISGRQSRPDFAPEKHCFLHL